MHVGVRVRVYCDAVQCFRFEQAHSGAQCSHPSGGGHGGRVQPAGLALRRRRHRRHLHRVDLQPAPDHQSRESAIPRRCRCGSGPYRSASPVRLGYARQPDACLIATASRRRGSRSGPGSVGKAGPYCGRRPERSPSPRQTIRSWPASKASRRAGRVPAARR